MPKYTGKSLEVNGGIISTVDMIGLFANLLWESGPGTIKRRLYSTTVGFQQSVNAAFVAAGPTGWIRDDDGSPAYLYVWSTTGSFIATFSAPAAAGPITWFPETRLSHLARQFEGETVEGTAGTVHTSLGGLGEMNVIVQSFSGLGLSVRDGDVVEFDAEFDLHSLGGNVTEIYFRTDYNAGSNDSPRRRWDAAVHSPQQVHMSGSHTLTGIGADTYVTDLVVRLRVLLPTPVGSTDIYGPVRISAKVSRSLP